MRAGSRIEIVLEANLEKDRVVAMNATVYDVQDRRYIISLTSPSLSRRHIGARVNASYIVTSGEQGKRRPVRMGFPATVAEYLEAYPLSSSKLVPAFVLKREGKPSEINLRMHYRVRPTAESDLALLAKGVKVNLIDISLGGVQFSHRRTEPPLEYGSTVVLTLSSGNKKFRIEGRIVRVNDSVQASGNVYDLENVMVKFIYLEREVESFLNKKIMMIERELLSAGKNTD